MKRPSFQFYPGDWKLNSKLRRCSLTARGAWLEIMCILHDNEDEYGVARFPLVELASTAGVPLECAQELAAKDVLKGSDDGSREHVYRPRHSRTLGEPVLLVDPRGAPCWFSSRMVEDEYRRSRQGAKSRFTGAEGQNPSPSSRKRDKPSPNRAPTASPTASPSQWQGEWQGDGSTSPSPSSLNPTGLDPVAKATAALPSGVNPPMDGPIAGKAGAAIAPAPGPGAQGSLAGVAPAVPATPSPTARRPVAAPSGPAVEAPRARPMEPLTPEEKHKRQVWRDAKALLELDGVPEKQKGTFLGLLHGKAGSFEIFAAAVKAAADVGARPAGGVRDYLTATVQRMVGQREAVANKQAALEAGSDQTVANWSEKFKRKETT